MRAFERPILLPLVMEMFGPLVGVRGRITQAHLRSLEDCVLHTWSSIGSRQDWLHSIRAALNLCQRAADWYPQALGLHLYATLDCVGPVQMEIGILGQRFWNCGRASLPDERFRPILDLYTCLYERLYLLVATPVVAAHALLNGKDVKSVIADDGRVRPVTVHQLEAQLDFRQGLLCAGLDTHVRNSISHGRYRVLSGDAIEMEDRRPSDNKVTWGPHVFSHGQLYDKTVELDLTCRALLAALVMFDVNNHSVFQERGYLPKRRTPVRVDVGEAMMRESAESIGFKLETWQEEPDETVRIGLKVAGHREHGPSEIFAGAEGRIAARYSMDVRTEEVPISRQVYFLLQLTLDWHEPYDSVLVEVTGEDETAAGKLRTSRAARYAIFEGKTSFQDVRKLADEDTLSDALMPVIIRGVPRRL